MFEVVPREALHIRTRRRPAKNIGFVHKPMIWALGGGPRAAKLRLRGGEDTIRDPRVHSSRVWRMASTTRVDPGEVEGDATAPSGLQKELQPSLSIGISSSK